MSIKSGAALTVLFATSHPTTGAATNADSLPTGSWYENGTVNGAVTVTVTNITTGLYKAAASPGALSTGTFVAIRIAATVNSVAGEGVIWQDTIDAVWLDDMPTTAEVNTEVDTALADIHLDHLLAVADSDTPVNNSIIAKLAAGLGDWSDYNPVTMSHEKIAGDVSSTKTSVGTPSNLGSGATVAANLVDIEGQTDDIGAAGAGLTALGDTRLANLDATVSSRAAAATLTTIGARIGTFTGTWVNTILGFFQALMRSDATLPSDIGGTFDDATDSLQAIRDRGDAAWTGGASAADIADAVWDEAIAGHATAGSAGATLAAVDPDAIVDALEAALAGVDSVTVVATVSGATATVYQYATWDATFTLSGSPALGDYEKLIFAVKGTWNQADSESVLYVDTTTGLVYIGQTTPTGASYGSLAALSATSFAVYVDVAEVLAKIAGNFAGDYYWWLKGIETSTTPDEAIVIAEGIWRIARGWVRQTT